MFAAVRAIHFAFFGNVTVDADCFAAGGAGDFIALVVVATAAATFIVIVVIVIIIFKGLKVFVNHFDLLADFGERILSILKVVSHIFKNIGYGFDKFVFFGIGKLHALDKSFEVCNFFRNSHHNFSFAVKAYFII